MTNINLEQCYSILDYLIKHNEKVYIKHSEEDKEEEDVIEKEEPRKVQVEKKPPTKEEKFNKIRKKILETIKMYEYMLQKCEEEGEAEIIQATLKTLRK